MAGPEKPISVSVSVRQPAARYLLSRAAVLYMGALPLRETTPFFHTRNDQPHCAVG